MKGHPTFAPNVVMYDTRPCVRINTTPIVMNTGCHENKMVKPDESLPSLILGDRHATRTRTVDATDAKRTQFERSHMGS